MNNVDWLPDLEAVPVGGRVWFEGERIGYTVQARSDRYLVCTKPFAPRSTVLYTVIDLQEGVRGTENLIFGMGAETREECEEMVARLERPEHPTEVSLRNRVALDVRKVEGVKYGR